MKWLKNIESIAKTANSGICPYCGSNDTNYSTKKISKDFGYCVIWCNKCKKATNISRIEIDEKISHNIEIPDDLIF